MGLIWTKNRKPDTVARLPHIILILQGVGLRSLSGCKAYGSVSRITPL